MLTSNGRIKLLLAALALVFFLGMLVISALTIRTPHPQRAALTAPELSSEPAEKNVPRPPGERKFARGPRPVQHPIKTHPSTPSSTQSNTGSSGTDSEQSDINTISLIGTIVSTIGTILSVLIAWLTYYQGQHAQKV